MALHPLRRAPRAAPDRRSESSARARASTGSRAPRAGLLGVPRTVPRQPSRARRTRRSAREHASDVRVAPATGCTLTHSSGSERLHLDRELCLNHGVDERLRAQGREIASRASVRRDRWQVRHLGRAVAGAPSARRSTPRGRRRVASGRCYWTPTRARGDRSYGRKAPGGHAPSPGAMRR